MPTSCATTIKVVTKEDRVYCCCCSRRVRSQQMGNGDESATTAGLHRCDGLGHDLQVVGQAVVCRRGGDGVFRVFSKVAAVIARHVGPVDAPGEDEHDFLQRQGIGMVACWLWKRARAVGCGIIAMARSPNNGLQTGQIPSRHSLPFRKWMMFGQQEVLFLVRGECNVSRLPTGLDWQGRRTVTRAAVGLGPPEHVEVAASHVAYSSRRLRATKGLASTLAPSRRQRRHR